MVESNFYRQSDINHLHQLIKGGTYEKAKYS